MNPLVAAAQTLSDQVDRLAFKDPVACCYNPLRYAWRGHRAYLEQFGQGPKRVILMGMNPGPWGMAQTGVPFGEIPHVRDWMGIETPIDKPAPEHPKRPIEGFACTRSEVSGRRLWSLFAERFGTPGAFFADHLVLNYCPLVFMGDTGRNITPDKLPAGRAARQLQEACDTHLATVLDALKPAFAIGVGAYAEKKLNQVAPEGMTVGRILHPSPASPAANRDWAGTVTRQLIALGVWA